MGPIKALEESILKGELSRQGFSLAPVGERYAPDIRKVVARFGFEQAEVIARELHASLHEDYFSPTNPTKMVLVDYFEAAAAGRAEAIAFAEEVMQRAQNSREVAEFIAKRMERVASEMMNERGEMLFSIAQSIKK